MSKNIEIGLRLCYTKLNNYGGFANMYEYDFCEYAVEKKKNGAYLAKIILCAIAAVLLTVTAFTVVIPLGGMSIGLIALVLIGVLVWYFSRFLSIEYEYTQTASELDFAAVYSKQYRKEKLSVDIKKSAKRIAPVNEAELRGIKVYDFRSESDSENGYMLIFEDDGTRRAVLFDATRRLITNLRRQSPSVVTLSDNLPEE